ERLMSSEICFRDYRATDLEAMFQLDEACFAEEFRFDRGSMREFAEEQNAIVLIAEEVGGQIVGFVIVHVERVATEWRAYVVTLDVTSECRRRGLGRRLMREVEAIAMAAGVQWMQLHVFTGNAGAIRFYERLGYERTSRQKNFYGEAGLDAFVYGKELHAL
ncbi:MAG TPA: N-acetyltransferase, partial [Edaphobacter sp.]|nr:N-acetyltransferase [Edaphobacter sp.]